jgi:hypothetical protein
VAYRKRREQRMKIRCLAASAADGFPWCRTPGKDVVVDRKTIARDVGFFLVFASAAGVVELPPLARIGLAAVLVATIDGYTKVISLRSAPILMIRVLVKLSLFSEEVRAAELKAEAENMTLSGLAVLAHSYASASGAKAVAYYSKGSASATFAVSPTGVSFRAREAYCKGDAKLRVFIDGVEKGTLTLTSQTFADYPLSVSSIGSDSHQIRLEYINDTYGNKCDRNAYLDYYTITTKDTVIDSDGDGVADGVDNCPSVANANQSDMAGDGIGNVCDSDKDGDAVANVSDNCPSVQNADQKDSDSDGIGDACDGTPFPPPDTASNPFAGEKL